MTLLTLHGIVPARFRAQIVACATSVDVICGICFMSVPHICFFDGPGFVQNVCSLTSTPISHNRRPSKESTGIIQSSRGRKGAVRGAAGRVYV